MLPHIHKKFSRRLFLIGGGALICQHCFLRLSNAQSLPQSVTVGSNEPVSLQCGVNNFKNFIVDNSIDKNIRRKSGIAEFDQNIPLETEWLNKLFRVKPEFGIFDDDIYAPSAITVQNKSGTYVLLGKNLLNWEIKRSPKNWQSSIIGILAHEWAHAFQFKSNWREKDFLWETHADYLSGWYLGNKKASGIIDLNIEIYSEFLFRNGGDGGFYNEHSHGKPEIRIRSMQAGYQHGLRFFKPGKLADIYFAAEKGFEVSLNLKTLK